MNVILINEGVTRLQPSNKTPWLDQQSVYVATDTVAPGIPTLSGLSVLGGVLLYIGIPPLNEDGTECTDFDIFNVYWSVDQYIDVDDPETYSGIIETKNTTHRFDVTATRVYFRAVAVDAFGNKSLPSDEISVVPGSFYVPFYISNAVVWEGPYPPTDWTTISLVDVTKLRRTLVLLGIEQTQYVRSADLVNRAITPPEKDDINLVNRSNPYTRYPIFAFRRPEDTVASKPGTGITGAHICHMSPGAYNMAWVTTNDLAQIQFCVSQSTSDTVTIRVLGWSV